MAVTSTFIPDALDLQQPLSVDAAYERSRSAALADTRVGPVGLEIEMHPVNLRAVTAPVTWPQVEEMTGALHGIGLSSAITVEPGGQVELSCPPAADIVTAVRGLRAETGDVRVALAKRGFGIAYVGADPVRPALRVNPRPRYRAMEQHFRATGLASAGAVMMNSTAALQVNLEAGPEQHWRERVAHAHRIGPTMLAIAANSPWLSGEPTGWKSARQRAWGSLDSRACGPVPGCSAGPAGGSPVDPAEAWARYAMHAPVVFIRCRGDAVQAVGARVPFEQWARGSVRLGNRAPTPADLDTHLTTLFPPVRLRGYLELRYLDVTGPGWWPAIAAVVTTLMDDPVAADAAAEATEETAPLWTEAARDGLGNAQLASSAVRCLAVAAARAPAEFGPAIGDLAELIGSRRCPGDLFSERIKQVGPAAALEELAHA
jgi:glutamate--cysteine ligase